MVQSYKNESKSQHEVQSTIAMACCDVWYKVTKMRANHNITSATRNNLNAVMYGTKLQKWEQITTHSTFSCPSLELWCMVQSYKNESKSQHSYLFWRYSYSCDVWYKVTKMRANHNDYQCVIKPKMLWCMVQSYKNESKSQLLTMKRKK